MSGFSAVPPDTNGAVGRTQFVQWVNYAWAVFDKTTGSIEKNGGGPFAGNYLWANSPSFKKSQCGTNNSGDPIAQYDKRANRWVLMQPVFTKPFVICVAVSTSPFANITPQGGSYHLYEFQIPNLDLFPDYPKLGIWPDGYYMSINLFTGLGFGGKFKGTKVCAFERNAMLAGEASPAVMCFDVGLFPNLLPSDLDGATLPPAGAPNYFLNLGDDSRSLNLWQFQVVDFAKGTANLFGPTNIPVASFSEACGGGICIAQLGTSRLLDSLGDRLMYRLAYRNFLTTGGQEDHESLVVTHSVTAGSTVGVRWYEIRNPRSCNPQNPGKCNPQSCIYQQHTFAGVPQDTNFRWMGSAAMDNAGDIAVGYSVSSSGMHPSIRFTGRVLTTDACNLLEGETSIIEGTGSQTNASNWGDYSSMSIDPVDDCTFWLTTEYLKADSNYKWSTSIASFKFPSCPTPSP